ncbi:MAG TPA: hypothetical protein PLD20_31425 [Blastocatellia bacterium]|nr:hypothetical protein [Blastocatellia bacterium]HMV85967.1 hypothetical protein [Blastocatellia bacterium]HMX29281.1 hypothetical protein [Blastocatellia bacterium]HMY76364.1 hypothetical protein [Blastocatellia bacterium]HMZ22484.1 hypothetical protein [Blastocatellia bacterium]
MKKNMLHSVAIFMFVLFCCSLPASAQSLERLVKARIPFDFQVGDKRLPAGEYTIKRDPQMTGFLVVEGAQRQVMVTVYTFPLHQSEKPGKPKLIFREYEGTHFLAEVKIEEHDCGYAIGKSKTERRLAKRSMPDSIFKND